MTNLLDHEDDDKTVKGFSFEKAMSPNKQKVKSFDFNPADTDVEDQEQLEELWKDAANESIHGDSDGEDDDNGFEGFSFDLPISPTPTYASVAKLPTGFTPGMTKVLELIGPCPQKIAPALTSIGPFSDERIDDELKCIVTGGNFSGVVAKSLVRLSLAKKKVLERKYTPGICSVGGCSAKAFTDKHISWCEEHRAKMMKPLKEKIDTEVEKMPKEVRKKVEESRKIDLSIDEIHQLLYGVISSRLRYEMMSRSGQEAKACKDILGAIATYRKRFNPDPFVKVLFEQAVTAIAALVKNYGMVAVTCASLAVAIPAVFIGIGVWRRDELLITMGCGGFIGAGVGGVAGVAAGQMIAASAASSAAASAAAAGASAAATSAAVAAAAEAGASAGAVLGPAGALTGALIGIGIAGWCHLNN